MATAGEETLRAGSFEGGSLVCRGMRICGFVVGVRNSKHCDQAPEKPRFRLDIVGEVQPLHDAQRNTVRFQDLHLAIGFDLVLGDRFQKIRAALIEYQQGGCGVTLLKRGHPKRHARRPQHRDRKDDQHLATQQPERER